ncbi:MAG: hypothetical protein NT154_18140 [Verrucomicrobia bacterium]|nr:hypothetical protein [Verrucomicrobiota bacterium]
MARKMRIEYAEAAYDVMARGNFKGSGDANLGAWLGSYELEGLRRRLEQVYENHNAEVEVRICEFRDCPLLWDWGRRPSKSSR